MAGKNTIQRRINAPIVQDGGDTTDSSVEDFIPPSLRSIQIPENISVSTQVIRSAITPEASITAEWTSPNGVIVDQYIIQISEDNTFPIDATRTLWVPGDQLSITINALKTGTEYNIQIAAVSKSVISDYTAYETITTLNDTTPCGPVTSATYDFTGINCLLSWINPTDDNFHHVRIDIYASNGGTLLHTFNSSVNHYTYYGAQNLIDTSGAGDPTLYVILTSVTVYGVDNITPVTLSPVNAAPSAPSVTVHTGITQLYGVITSLPPQDFDSNEFVWKNSGGTVIQTTVTQSASDTFLVTTTDTYSLEVRVKDIFGNYSSITTVSSLYIDAFTTETLRADSIYKDSISTDFNSNPNKTVLKDDATGAGITYASSAGAYRNTTVEYPLIERIRRISLKLGSGAANFYIGLSLDDITYTFYSGSISSGYILTAVANEAAAQASAPLFSALTYGYAELPTTVEARFVKVFHRNTGSSYRLDEFYGQRWVIADVIKAGDIQTLHLAVGSVVADRISVSNLSAISADMGSITAGTITGATIRTAASGQRVLLDTTGLKTIDATGNTVGYLSAIDGSISIIAPADAGSWVRSYGFTYGGNTLGGVQGYSAATAGSIQLRCEPRVGFDSQTVVISQADTNRLSIAALEAYNNTGGSTFASVTAYSRFNDGIAHDSNVNLFADSISFNASGASPLTWNINGLSLTGYIRASSIDSSGGILFGGTSNQITQDTSNFVWDDTSNKLFIGTNAQGNGIGKVVVKGTDASVAGPHVELLTAADAYPVMQVLSYTHDNMEISFDAYLNSSSAWTSSDAGSNYQIRKNGDKFGWFYGSGIAQGSTITWKQGLIMDTAGKICIGTAAPVGQLDVYVNDSGTTNDTTNLNLIHTTSGTPAAGFGAHLIFGLDTNGGSARAAGSLTATIVTATDASRKFLITHGVYDTALREYLRGEASGTAPKLGALGAGAVIRQSVAAAITDTADATYSANEVTMLGNLKTLLNDMRTAGINLGFWS